MFSICNYVTCYKSSLGIAESLRNLKTKVIVTQNYDTYIFTRTTAKKSLIAQFVAPVIHDPFSDALRVNSCIKYMPIFFEAN